QRERAGGDGLDAHSGALAEAHDRALAEVLLDLPDGHFERLLTVHWCSPRGGGDGRSGEVASVNVRRGCDAYVADAADVCGDPSRSHTAVIPAVRLPRTPV